MSRKLAIQLTNVCIIVLCWLFVGFLLTLYDHFLLHSELATGYSSNYSFNKNLAFNLSSAFLGASLGSVWLIFFVNEKFKERSYGFTLGMVALSFFVIVAFIAAVLGVIFVKYNSGSWPFVNASATEELYKNLTNPFHLKNVVVWANVVLLTQIGIQVNDKFGQGLLKAFITGKYHRPKREQRIFMFVDLIGSTSMAEQLGNEKYYLLLKDFFAHITDSIIYNRGKIYQYVGDEVVISWEAREVQRNHDYLNCYFEMRKVMDFKKEYYLEKYGLLPDFKAAIHYGDVTVGEIGIVKRDLTFSGDVLNTAARIMGYCKTYEKKLLVSEKLFQYAGAAKGQFKFIRMGEELLRGKSTKTRIYTVLQK